MPAARTVRLRITGRVQGVWFRDWTVQTARGLGLGGWVRNLGDGSVEALAGGAADAIATFIAACHEGPPKARVDQVTVTDTDEGVAEGFGRAPTL